VLQVCCGTVEFLCLSEPGFIHKQGTLGDEGGLLCQGNVLSCEGRAGSKEGAARLSVGMQSQGLANGNALAPAMSPMLQVCRRCPPTLGVVSA
jgi:hypothetical protein